MRAKKCRLLLLLLLAVEPAQSGFWSAVWDCLSGLPHCHCQWRECCRAPWYSPNLPHLKESLTANVFGQHLVTKLVTKKVKAHVENPDPKKALVMSFHGWTGSGKNFVAKFIAESLFKLGMNSKFVHLFNSPYHFPDQKMADIYKLRVQDWIRGNVTDCQNSLFIFDEIDKMPDGVIDGIKPFLDFYSSLDGQNYRKSIFIFLSNTGGRDITKQTYKLWKEGRRREDIAYTDLEMLVNKEAFNE